MAGFLRGGISGVGPGRLQFRKTPSRDGGLLVDSKQVREKTIAIAIGTRGEEDGQQEERRKGGKEERRKEGKKERRKERKERKEKGR
ncbi:hypothetical protein F2P79_025707 [Pimephales promelas]|nr:hypothetical protein F2P79_025707 [Pimephales promelas]